MCSYGHSLFINSDKVAFSAFRDLIKSYGRNCSSRPEFVSDFSMDKRLKGKVQLMAIAEYLSIVYPIIFFTGRFGRKPPNDGRKFPRMESLQLMSKIPS